MSLLATAVVAALVGGVGFAVPASAATYTVTTTADVDDAGACTTALTTGTGTDGKLSLREAICEARNSGTGTVTVPAGTYAPTQALTVAGNGGAAVDVTITGAGAGSTVLDGGGTDRVFLLDAELAGNVHVTIGGLTVRGGRGTDGFGGGGILAGAPDATQRDSLTLTDCRLTGNTNDTDADLTDAPGGAVQMAGGSLSVTNCEIDGNTAGSSAGGGVWFSAQHSSDTLSISGGSFHGNTVRVTSSYNGGGALALEVGSTGSGSMTVDDTSFTGNTVTATGSAEARGGAVLTQFASPTFTRATFTGNTATGGAAAEGGALYIAGDATVRYSRIVGNTSTGGGAVRHIDTGTVSAPSNWWGCNAGPGNADCDNTVGVSAPAPRLQLAVTAVPATVSQGGTAAVTASFRTDSAGTAVTVANLATLVGLPVIWSASKGSMSGTQGQVQPDGTATGTFTGATGGGVGYARATVDGFAVQAAIVVDAPPVVTTQPSDQTVNAGQAASFTTGASGWPTPSVQWQLSTDAGTTWNPVPAQTSTTLTVATTAGDHGNRYRAVFTNSVGTATSDPATLTVHTVPAVTTQPTDQTVDEGDPVSFTAAASGRPTPTVQWQESTDGTQWTNLTGKTAPTLTFTPTSSQSGNRYRAVFTNAAGNATSRTALLTVRTVPTVTTQPADQTVNAGSSVTFTAAASGRPTPTVRWQVSIDGTTWTTLAGETATTLTFTAASADNGNSYRAVFTNSAGNDTTGAATLTVRTVPVVTTDPADTTVDAGDTATFTAAATGSPTPTVRWEVSTDGVTWTTLAGETATTLTFATTAGQNGNRYRAVFTNAAGDATTLPATLTVLRAPVVTSGPTDQTVTAGDPVSFTAASSGSPTPTVRWQVSTNGALSWTTLAGETATTLTFTAASADNGNSYRAVFTNSAGSDTTGAATLTVRTAPVVTADPADTAVDAGDTATFTAAATGSPTPTVRWEVSTDGVTWTTLAGETAATLTFATTAGQNGDRYRAVFSNPAGDATTLPATLTVRTVPTVTTQPADQTVNAGSSVTFTAAASGRPTPTVRWQ
ncbi:MAG: hypothetical protein JWN54_1598, partial [Mycobacterium sp.]|nr:hypothetical protein [Mycobacterium sp.]